MNPLWTSVEIEGATLGRASKPFTVAGIAIDSRKLKPGDLYVAIKGERKDGHDFVSDAFKVRAAAALVSKPIEADGPTLLVAHTQRALEDLARAARARTNATIVAVTGSAGKTTTKEMLKLAFGALGLTHVSGASFNNHWGVPFSLASLPREAEYGVFEIGMNHFGEIRALVPFAKPHIALITTIAPAHLEFFGNCEAIADAKSEIFEGLVPGGTAILPSDSPYLDRLITRARQQNVHRVMTFGSKGEARLISCDETDEGLRLKAEILGKPVEARVGAPGRHIASNALGALLTVAVAGGDVLNAAAALREFTALKGRGQRLRIGEIEIIDESYNANPASMAAALSLLSRAKGRKIAVLGDMLEMGPEGAALHAGLAPALDAADLIFLCGPLMKSLWDALPADCRTAYAPSSKEIAPVVAAALRPGDTVLVKGSNGSRMGLVIEAVKGT
ncbi:MAG TPA: UDP-N-acetylmuramoyl-tripeptide--D-alanyl-D-alanine ligase [Rhizomicrobium sp.]|nr:UDP-N-acetylmuramoyl-tripeptide--D-alanyl-D-alanine ligase [Rhizomicrobium sp.]